MAHREEDGYVPGPGWYFIGDEELHELTDVLRSREMSRYRFDDDSQASPSKVYQFEREFSRILGARHCLGMNSCTSALLAGLAALGIGPGDEVIVPGYTFIASIAAIAHARAIPVLAEIDDTLTLDPADVAAKVTSRTKAILAVHMLGAPCDMSTLGEIAGKHGLYLVEDVAQACGGSFEGRPLGSVGAFGAFSLNVFKMITAGDGGVLSTNDTTLFERAFAFHDHGSKPFRLGVADDGSFLGLNLRMHELTGAVALAQVRKLPTILGALHHRKALFKRTLGELPGARFRRFNDAGGECATTLTLTFEDASTAARVAGAVGSKTLDRSGRHNYANMIQLVNRAMPWRNACPFSCTERPADVKYEPGMLPKTDDLLRRTLCLSVGVRDSYLGADFGVDVTADDHQVVAAAERFRELTTDILC